MAEIRKPEDFQPSTVEGVVEPIHFSNMALQKILSCLEPPFFEGLSNGRLGQGWIRSVRPFQPVNFHKGIVKIDFIFLGIGIFRKTAA